MKQLFSKIFTLTIWILHPKVKSHYRWFLRFYYLSKLKQLKFLWKDYFKRRPYKVISFRGEFQQELINVLPFAYWHYKNGTLKKTQSCYFTSPLYFFSPNHEEIFGSRIWEDNFNTSIPNTAHNVILDRSKWLPPPFKEEYRNDNFLYDKPILVIANRYNTEWNSDEPISFLSIEILDWIIKQLGDKYTIIYNRPGLNHITNDNSQVLELNEVSWLTERHPDVIILMHLFEEQKVSNIYNEFQMMAYANANHFISVHGGTATLASYFGGVNIIYSKKGLEHDINEFENIFPRLSGAEIYHAKDDQFLKKIISEYL